MELGEGGWVRGGGIGHRQPDRTEQHYIDAREMDGEREREKERQKERESCYQSSCLCASSLSHPSLSTQTTHNPMGESLQHG